MKSALAARVPGSSATIFTSTLAAATTLMGSPVVAIVADQRGRVDAARRAHRADRVHSGDKIHARRSLGSSGKKLLHEFLETLAFRLCPRRQAPERSIIDIPDQDLAHENSSVKSVRPSVRLCIQLIEPSRAASYPQNVSHFPRRSSSHSVAVARTSLTRSGLSGSVPANPRGTQPCRQIRDRHMASERYNAPEREKHWQKVWDAKQTSSAPPPIRRSRSAMCSRCSPIPRGASTWGTCATTPWATCWRATSGPRASTCCIPMGWDAFGMPAENAAMESKIAPGKMDLREHRRDEGAAQVHGPVARLGREVATCDPSYYVHQQRMFLDMSARASPTGARPRSTGTRSTRPCSPTSR